MARALLHFDVAAVLPAGAVVLEAQLVLQSSRAATGDTVISLHPVLAVWGEGSSEASRAEGTGAPAQPGDVTWTHRLYPDDAWRILGGDFGPPVAETRFGKEVAAYAWGPSDAVTAQVQAWLDDPASNLGWLLSTPEEPGRITAVRFHSREGGAERTGPLLIVTYRKQAAS